MTYTNYKKTIAKLLKAYHKKWNAFGETKKKNGSKKSRT